MTIVVAIESGNKVVMGGDSFCGTDISVDICDSAKVFKIKNVGVGISGNLSVESIFKFCIKEYGESVINKKWLMNDFPEIFRQECISRNAAEYQYRVAYLPDNSAFLIALNGEVFTLGEDFGIYRSSRGYAAIGAGERHAMGALRALEETRFSAKKKIKIALETSCDLNHFVARPFHIKEFK